MQMISCSCNPIGLFVISITYNLTLRYLLPLHVSIPVDVRIWHAVGGTTSTAACFRFVVCIVVYPQICVFTLLLEEPSSK